MTSLAAASLSPAEGRALEGSVHELHEEYGERMHGDAVYAVLEG